METVKCQKAEMNSSIQTLSLEIVFVPGFRFSFRDFWSKN